ncbi:MAG TPA: hypothetical protein VGQ83_35475 [Polyangia bacterium]|jgi:hypothetical protein
MRSFAEAGDLRLVVVHAAAFLAAVSLQGALIAIALTTPGLARVWRRGLLVAAVAQLLLLALEPVALVLQARMIASRFGAEALVGLALAGHALAGTIVAVGSAATAAALIVAARRAARAATPAAAAAAAPPK